MTEKLWTYILEEPLNKDQNNLGNYYDEFIISTFEKGVNIYGKDSYDNAKAVLAKKGVYLCDYLDINVRGETISQNLDFDSTNYEFSLTYYKEEKIVYLYPFANGPFASSFWYIKDGKFHARVSFVQMDKSSNNTDFFARNNIENKLNNNDSIIDIEEETEIDWDQTLDTQIEELRKLKDDIAKWIWISVKNIDTNNIKKQIAIETYWDMFDWVNQHINEEEVISEKVNTAPKEIELWDVQKEVTEKPWEGKEDNEYKDLQPDQGNIVKSKWTNWSEFSNNKGLQQKEMEVIERELIYEVQKWDNLWNIAKKYCNLPSNRDIANVVNKIVKYNIDNDNAYKLCIDIEKDGIKWDRIYPWQNIILPPEIIFRKQIFQRINE